MRSEIELRGDSAAEGRAPRGAGRDTPAARAYLDNWAATTMVPRAVQALSGWGVLAVGDPAADHSEARRARAMLEDFREELAVECGFPLSGPGAYVVVFTSGAAESNSAVVHGAVQSFTAKMQIKPHVVISEAEPYSILSCCARLERDGRCRLTVLPVGKA